MVMEKHGLHLPRCGFGDSHAAVLLGGGSNGEESKKMRRDETEAVKISSQDTTRAVSSMPTWSSSSRVLRRLRRLRTCLGASPAHRMERPEGLCAIG